MLFNQLIVLLNFLLISWIVIFTISIPLITTLKQIFQFSFRFYYFRIKIFLQYFIQFPSFSLLLPFLKSHFNLIMIFLKYISIMKYNHLQLYKCLMYQNEFLTKINFFNEFDVVLNFLMELQLLFYQRIVGNILFLQ